MAPSTPSGADDHRHMTHALTLARRGLGRVAPNPAVGCVLVRDGLIVGRGYTQPGGRPHAEVMALQQAGAAAQGSTAYVTLEPCAHHGQTGPCADALAAAGVVRVVVAMTDPDPRVDGGGLARLRAAGIEVVEGILQAAAKELQAGFLSRVDRARPIITLKIASTADGHIATRSGQSQWITGAPAREHGHMMRATHDAIMIGSGTALADSPSLTCRLPGLEDRSPVRIVLDRRGQVPVTGQLFDDRAETWLFSARKPERMPPSCRFFEVAATTGLSEVVKQLAAEGLTRVLVEGGAGLHYAFWSQGLFDCVAWYRSGLVLGADGQAAVGPLGRDKLADGVRLRRLAFRQLGDDLLETFQRID